MRCASWSTHCAAMMAFEMAKAAVGESVAELIPFGAGILATMTARGPKRGLAKSLPSLELGCGNQV